MESRKKQLLSIVFIPLFLVGPISREFFDSPEQGIPELDFNWIFKHTQNPRLPQAGNSPSRDLLYLP